LIPAGIGVVFLLMSLTGRRDAKHLPSGEALQ
jgi:hypothetical protein